MSYVLELELSTLYVRTADGRLERERLASAATFAPPPLVSVACGAEGLVWACASALPSPIVAEIGARLQVEPTPQDGVPAVGWAPAAGDRILDLLPDLGSVRGGLGPSFVAPVDRRPAPAVRTDVELRRSTDADLASVAPLLPERDAVLDPPWVLALVDGEAAAVCETSRSAPESVEAGVWTYERHRRAGLATLVTSAWLDLVTVDRTAFYSTSADNAGSQGVARRLGLTPLAQWWQVRSVAAD
jgi:hypothetical protein